MSARCRCIVAFGLGLAALVPVSPAAAGDVAVIVRDSLSLQDLARAGAVGEFVPGAGPTVGRDTALASLERGQTRSSLLGGKPSGPRLIRVTNAPAAITILVALPPRGRNENTRRYPVAILGGGYHGILTSSSTRIRGLVSIADIAPTALALEHGRRPVIRAAPDSDASGTVAGLERRIGDVRSVRWPAVLLLIGGSLLWMLLAFRFRSPLAGRAALLAAPASLAGSLLMAGAGLTEPWAVGVLVGLTVFGLAPLAARPLHRPHLLAGALAAVLVAYLVVLAAWPETNAVSAFGPHPDEGGRFYGVPNRVETLLLASALVPATVLSTRWLVPFALVALGTVGLGATGADGGGLVVFAAAFLALGGLRIRPSRAWHPPGTRLARARHVPGTGAVIAALAALALALAVIGIDAALGGSSHVTRAVGGGPGELLHDFVRRVELSFASATSSVHQVLFLAIGLAALAVPALAKPRTALRTALFIAIGVSLLVNDAPVDSIGYGALVTTAVWSWERLKPPVRRSA